MPQRRAASESSDVARLVKLHHRRRGWAWVAIGSAFAFAVYGILIGSRTGTAEILSDISALFLLALILAGLIVVIVDTSRLHHADPAVQASAKGSVRHHPLYAHAHRYPPRHHGSWIFAIVALVAMTGITVALLPAEVNSWAYVAGAEHPDTFNPVAYGHVCHVTSRGGGGCQTVTEGYLSRSGTHVTWDAPVPLGQPFSARDPLWAWGRGRHLIRGDGTAIANIIAGLFFDGVTLLLLYVLLVIVRGTSSKRSQRKPVPARPGPHGGHPVRQPHRGHPPAGTRRKRGRR
jgi:hypothetical protein